MDALSGMLSALRLRSQLLSITEIGEDIALRSPGGAGLVAFHYVIEGECLIEVGGGQYRLKAGDLGLFSHGGEVVVAVGAAGEAVDLLTLKAEQGLPQWSWQSAQSPTAPHVLKVGAMPYATRLLNGMFSLESAEAALMLGPGPVSLIFASGDAALEGWTRACLEFVVAESADPKPGFAAIAGHALELLLADALRHWVLREQPTGWARGVMDPRIRRALEALQDQPGRRWTLKELARIAGQSRSGFAAEFTRVVGETPMAHLARWRMHLAAQRLREGGGTIAAIAEDCGYASGFAFARAFRAHYGCAPGEWRMRGGVTNEV